MTWTRRQLAVSAYLPHKSRDCDDLSRSWDDIGRSWDDIGHGCDDIDCDVSAI